MIKSTEISQQHLQSANCPRLLFCGGNREHVGRSQGDQGAFFGPQREVCLNRDHYITHFGGIKQAANVCKKISGISSSKFHAHEVCV